jgi:DNA-directed RNA polymerase subunit RPC12/RpoP
MGYERTHVCSKCKREWEIYKVNTIMRDKDSIRCECGELIE